MGSCFYYPVPDVLAKFIFLLPLYYFFWANSPLQYVSRYALEFPVPLADLIALRPGYRVLPDLETVPNVPRHTQFALMEAATLDQMFETTLPAP